jgi:hypothetical protein
MEITSELLELIEERAKQVSQAKFGATPDKVILEGGSIKLIFENYCCGSADYESEYIGAEELLEDLDVIVQKAKEAKIKQQEEAQRRLEKIRQQEAERKEQQERETYLTLKKKFDGKENNNY